jgi:hypothetical protein
MTDGGKFPVSGIVGPHGHAETTVEQAASGMEIDLSPWVNEDGIGNSAGGHPVRKKFPGPAVVFEGLEWDNNSEETVADRAYVGEIIERTGDQTLLVEFDADLSTGTYSVTFSPTRASQDDSGYTDSITYVDRDPDKVRSELRDYADDKERVADGGREDRNHTSARDKGELVRKYTTPPGNTLSAYRSDDGEHHIVVSDRSEPISEVEERVPAIVERPVPGQKLWTIPDNWEKRVHSTRENIAYGLFYIPESEVWAKVSIPTNDRVTEAWYRVKTVGALDINPVGELGSKEDVRRFADKYKEQYDSEAVDEDVEAFLAVAINWHNVEEDLQLTIEWVKDEGLDQKQTGDQPISANSDWQIEFHQDQIFRPGETLKQIMDFAGYSIPMSVVLDELRNADLLPSYYKFKLGIDDSDVGMEYYIQGMTEAGASPTEAIDYYMVEVEDRTQTAWADTRGVNQSSVSNNVKEAIQKLS